MESGQEHLQDKNIGISRRSFLAGVAAAAITTAKSVSVGQETTAQQPQKINFKLKYASHFGMFKHHAGNDVIDQLKFITDVGFTAIEDNGMMFRPVEEQEKIAKEMSRLNMTMGVFVGYGRGKFGEKTFVKNDKDTREMIVQQIKKAVEVAKRVNAKWFNVIPCSYDNGVEMCYQTANVIENLKWCTSICELAKKVIVLEPLNPWKNHPGLFLTKIPQAYQICKAVGSPYCKILNDLYHQQITEGNLIPNIDMAWEEIAYFQIGDNPGRNEPTTGEINYKNVFKHIYDKGYKGILGMEHGISKPGKEGEKALIDAYTACDDF